MTKSLRITLLIFLIIGPIIFYKALNKDKTRANNSIFFNQDNSDFTTLPRVALIFDDLGESLSDLKKIYSLGIPLTIAVIPDLKFSRNIAHISARCGFSVFIHLPLGADENKLYKNSKYTSINSDLSRREIEALLRHYLNSIRIAIGVNNHIGSTASEDPDLMKIILEKIKQRGLIFIDNHTSSDSVAYRIANQNDLICGYNEGFLDTVDDPEKIKEQMVKLSNKAKEKGKIIIIAHPRKNTINFLKNNLATLKKEVEFITIKDYFQL